MMNNGVEAEVIFHEKVVFPQGFYSCLLISDNNRLDCRMYFDNREDIVFPAEVVIQFLDKQKAQDVLSKNEGKFSIWEFGIIGEGKIIKW